VPGPAGPFGVIQASHQLDIGKINDYITESAHQQYVWALALARSYYGQPAQRNYWNGCSTGGRQGLELAGRFGQDFDGILAGAPATYIQEFQSAESWPALVNRDDVIGAGHFGIAFAQYSNAVKRAIAACDVQGYDVVADGVVDDPRQCQYSAQADKANLLPTDGGTCVGSNCLTLVQAKAIDKIWDGPRNHTGVRLWHPWNKTVAGFFTSLLLGPTIPSGQLTLQQNVQWNHRDVTASSQNVYSSRTLASANPLGLPNPTALEDEMALGDKPGNPANTGGPENLMRSADYDGIIENVFRGPKRGKIITWQGTVDNLIFWQDSVEYYRNVATAFGRGKTDFDGMQSWFRYYHAPGVDHCGGGVGASPVAPTLPDGQSQIFDDLVNWVERGIEPQSAGDSTHKGILATGPGTFGTRPICPWPTTAIYNGSGSTAVASNYRCGGNLDADVIVLCRGLHTRFGHETTQQLDFKEQGLFPQQCGLQGEDGEE
jgi:hypothetical protein